MHECCLKHLRRKNEPDKETEEGGKQTVNMEWKLTSENQIIKIENCLVISLQGNLVFLYF